MSDGDVKATMHTLQLMEDGKTLDCDEHSHECRFLWVAFRTMLEELQKRDEEIARLRVALLEKKPTDRTH